MNMKKICSVLAITALVSFSIGAVAFKQMGLGFTNLGMGGIYIDISKDELLREGKSIYGKENIDTSGVNQIKVSVSSSNTYIAYEDRSDVEIIFEGRYIAPDSYVPPKLVVNKSGSVIDATIEYTPFSNMSVSSYHNLLIRLPMAYKDKISISSSSGDIMYQGGECSEFVVNTSSGSFIHSDVVSTDFENETVNYSLKDIYAGILEVKTSSGDINVQSSTSDKLKMDASSGDIKVNGKTENAEIEAVSGYISGTIESEGLSTVNTSSGDIDINVTAKNVEIKTTSGSVEGSALASESVKINTSSGDVDLESVTGEVNAKTVSGRLKINTDNGVKGIKVEASSGDVMLSKVIGITTISTVSGVVEIDNMEITDDISIKTSSGDVRVSNIGNEDFNLDVKTSSGDINTNLAVTINGKQDEDTLKGTVGSGGYTLEVETVSGSIDLD